MNGTKSKYVKQPPKDLDLPPADVELFTSQVSDMALNLTKKYLHNATCDNHQTAL